MLDENDVLWRKRCYMGRPIFQLFVPQRWKAPLLKEYHDNLISGGHHSALKTYINLREKYYWRGMKSDTFRHVNACLKCASARAQSLFSKPLLRPIEPPSEPWERVSVDLLKFNRTVNGNIYALVVICNLSKFTCALPLMCKEAKEVVSAFVQIFAILGYPKQMISDLGI
jgi:hypothetical protein